MPIRPEVCKKIECPLYGPEDGCYLSNKVVLENPYGRGAKKDMKKLLDSAGFASDLVRGACEETAIGEDS